MGKKTIDWFGVNQIGSVFQVVGTVVVNVGPQARAKKIAQSLNVHFRSLMKPRPKSPGRHARRKGHQFEREGAVMLRSIFPEARRQLEYHSDDANGVDLQNTGQFKFQFKKCKAYVSINTISEITHCPELGDIPVLVTAADGAIPMAVLPFDDLLLLIKTYVQNGNIDSLPERGSP